MVIRKQYTSDSFRILIWLYRIAYHRSRPTLDLKSSLSEQALLRDIVLDECFLGQSRTTEHVLLRFAYKVGFAFHP